MSKINFKITKSKLTKFVNGIKKLGWYCRILTNGTADYDDIVEIASMNTTANPAELRMALQLCMNAVVYFLKKGMIVDLGPLGKIYPSVSGKWAEDPDDLKLSDLEGKVNFRATEDVLNAVRNANFSWASAKESTKPTTDEEAGDTDETENPTIIDTSTGTTDVSTNDTSTGTDVSTGGDASTNGGDDLPPGNG